MTDEENEREIVIKHTFDKPLVDKIFNDLLLNYMIEKHNLEFDSKCVPPNSTPKTNAKSGELIRPDDQRWDPILRYDNVTKGRKNPATKTSLRVSWGE